MPIRSLEKHALDNLTAQLLATIGNARVVGPSAPLTPLDARYMGTLKSLLSDAFPGTPEALFSAVREDLVVVQQLLGTPSALVGFEPATLRVAKPHASAIDELREYSALLNVTIEPSRYLDTDLHGATLTFQESFFAPRSISGWKTLSTHLARLCTAMDELRKRSGLKQSEVVHEDHSTNLVLTSFASGEGEELELAPV